MLVLATSRYNAWHSAHTTTATHQHDTHKLCWRSAFDSAALPISAPLFCDATSAVLALCST